MRTYLGELQTHLNEVFVCVEKHRDVQITGYQFLHEVVPVQSLLHTSVSPLSFCHWRLGWFKGKIS